MPVLAQFLSAGISDNYNLTEAVIYLMVPKLPPSFPHKVLNIHDLLGCECSPQSLCESN